MSTNTRYLWGKNKMGSFTTTSEGSIGTYLAVGSYVTIGEHIVLTAMDSAPDAAAGVVYFDGTNLQLCTDGTNFSAVTTS